MEARTTLRDAISEPEPAADAVRELVELGLTLNEARVYLGLLGFAPATAAEVAHRSGVPRPKVYAALRSLEERGFCATVAERVARFRPLPADVALGAWIRQREHERRAQAERDEQIGERLMQALPRPQRTVPEPGLEYMEAILGRARTTEALARLIGGATRSVVMMQQPPFLQPRSLWNVAEAEAARRGVRVCVVYTRRAVLDPKRYADLVRAGGEARVVDELPMKLLVRDGVEAMISLRDPMTGEVGLTSAIIRHPDLVRPLELMFERAWRKARPIE